MFVQIAHALTFAGWAIFHGMQNHTAAHLSAVTDRLIAGAGVNLIANGIVLWYVSGLLHDKPGKWRTMSCIFGAVASVGIIVVQAQMINHLADAHARVMLGLAIAFGLLSHLFAYMAGFTLKRM